MASERAKVLAKLAKRRARRTVELAQETRRLVAELERELLAEEARSDTTSREVDTHDDRERIRSTA